MDLTVGRNASTRTSRFSTRGVVLYPWDISDTDWPNRAAEAGFNSLSLHAARRLDILVEFVASEPGRELLNACRHLGIDVEYKLHAMGDLLPLIALGARDHRRQGGRVCAGSEADHRKVLLLAR